MRAFQFIIAAAAAAMAAPVVAQDFGAVARDMLGTATRDLPKRTTQRRPAKSGDPIVAAPPTEQAEGSIVVAEDMPVVSSDGVRVAVVKHTTTGGTTYAPDKTFFTADPYYRLRRIYGREATASGGIVRLKMTAAQYRARNQNPD